MVTSKANLIHNSQTSSLPGVPQPLLMPNMFWITSPNIDICNLVLYMLVLAQARPTCFSICLVTGTKLQFSNTSKCKPHIQVTNQENLSQRNWQRIICCFSKYHSLTIDVYSSVAQLMYTTIDLMPPIHCYRK